MIHFPPEALKAAVSLLKMNQDELGINRQTNFRRSTHGGSTHPNHIPIQLKEFIRPDTTSMRQLIDFGSGLSVNPFIISKLYPHVSVIAIEADEVRVETACAIINREWHRISLQMPNVVKNHRLSSARQRFRNGGNHYNFEVIHMDWTRPDGFKAADYVYWSNYLGHPGNVITITNHNFDGVVQDHFEHIVMTCAHKSTVVIAYRHSFLSRERSQFVSEEKITIRLPIYHFGWIPGAHPVPIQETRPLKPGENPEEIIYETFEVFRY